MTTDRVLMETLEVLEGWPDLWRYPDLLRQQGAQAPAAILAGKTLTEFTLGALASPVDAAEIFKVLLRSGDFAAARTMLASHSFQSELPRLNQSIAVFHAEIEAAVTTEKRRLHVIAEGLRLRALRTGQLDSALARQIQHAVASAEHSRHKSEGLLREIERKLGEMSRSPEAESSPVLRRWPFTDSAVRICRWFLGEESAPRDAVDWAPAREDEDAQRFLTRLQAMCSQDGKADAAAAASLVAAIERLLGLPKRVPTAVQIHEGLFRSALRGLDSPWLPELGIESFPDGVPIFIACNDDAQPARDHLPPTLFLFFSVSGGETVERPERSLQISPATFFSLLRDTANRLDRFLAELGTQVPRTFVHQEGRITQPAMQGADAERRAFSARRNAFLKRLAVLGIHDLQPTAEVLDRLVFFGGGIARLEGRLIWEIAQRQRFLRRRRQARLDLEDIQAAYDSSRFQEYALGQLLGTLDSSPVERLVLGSLCEALGVELLLYPVTLVDLRDWLQMTDRPVPEALLAEAVRALIGRRFLEKDPASIATDKMIHSVRLPPNGVGHLILRELGSPDRVRSYIDSAYNDVSR